MAGSNRGRFAPVQRTLAFLRLAAVSAGLGLADQPSHGFGGLRIGHPRKPLLRRSVPAGPDIAKAQRSGRGIVKDNWSIGTHEFIGEKGYAGQKFRVVVEEEVPERAPGEVR